MVLITSHGLLRRFNDTYVPRLLCGRQVIHTLIVITEYYVVEWSEVQALELGYQGSIPSSPLLQSGKFLVPQFLEL